MKLSDEPGVVSGDASLFARAENVDVFEGVTVMLWQAQHKAKTATDKARGSSKDLI